MADETFYEMVGRAVLEQGHRPSAKEILEHVVFSPTVEDVDALRAKLRAGAIVSGPLTFVTQEICDFFIAPDMAQIDAARRRAQAAKAKAKLWARAKASVAELCDRLRPYEEHYKTRYKKGYYKLVGQTLFEQGRMPSNQETLLHLMRFPTAADNNAFRAIVQAGKIAARPLTPLAQELYELFAGSTVAEADAARHHVQATATAQAPGVTARLNEAAEIKRIAASLSADVLQKIHRTTAQLLQELGSAATVAEADAARHHLQEAAARVKGKGASAEP